MTSGKHHNIDWEAIIADIEEGTGNGRIDFQ